MPIKVDVIAFQAVVTHFTNKYTKKHLKHGNGHILTALLSGYSIVRAVPRAMFPDEEQQGFYMLGPKWRVVQVAKRRRELLWGDLSLRGQVTHPVSGIFETVF